MNNQSKKSKFFDTKTDLKKKTENPNESVMNRSVKSTCVDCIRIPTNDFSHTIFCTEGVMSCNRIIHRLRTSMLDTL